MFIFFLLFSRGYTGKVVSVFFFFFASKGAKAADRFSLLLDILVCHLLNNRLHMHSKQTELKPLHILMGWPVCITGTCEHSCQNIIRKMFVVF